MKLQINEVKNVVVESFLYLRENLKKFSLLAILLSLLSASSWGTFNSDSKVFGRGLLSGAIANDHVWVLVFVVLMSLILAFVLLYISAWSRILAIKAIKSAENNPYSLISKTKIVYGQVFRIIFLDILPLILLALGYGLTLLGGYLLVLAPENIANIIAFIVAVLLTVVVVPLVLFVAFTVTIAQFEVVESGKSLMDSLKGAIRLLLKKPLLTSLFGIFSGLAVYVQTWITIKPATYIFAIVDSFNGENTFLFIITFSLAILLLAVAIIAVGYISVFSIVSWRIWWSKLNNS